MLMTEIRNLRDLTNYLIVLKSIAEKIASRADVDIMKPVMKIISKKAKA